MLAARNQETFLEHRPIETNISSAKKQKHGYEESSNAFIIGTDRIQHGSSKLSLAENRQALAHGFSAWDAKFIGSPGACPPL